MICMVGKNKLGSELRLILRFCWLVIGAAIVAIGLEIFLVPNHIIDGGVVGISIVTSYLTEIPLGILLVILNLPFLFVGYKHIGKTFVICTFIGLVALALFVSLLHPIPRITDDLLLAAIFGGVLILTRFPKSSSPV